MRNIDRSSGLRELRKTRNKSLGLFWSVGLFSIFINLLMLTGPLFMLQVYDRVLGSRSEETLVALFTLMAFLYLMMGTLEWARGRVLARLGARFQADLDQRVFSAILRKKTALGPGGSNNDNQLKDLETVQRFLASPVLAGLFDLPWTPIFLLGISIFHPWLGILAISGGGLLIIITVLNQLTTRTATVKAGSAAMKGNSSECSTKRAQHESSNQRGFISLKTLHARMESLSLSPRLHRDAMDTL